MSESGWLTRSLEQNHAYTLDYVGEIRDKTIKNAFLQILNDVEVNKANASAYLTELFALLLRQIKAPQIIVAATPDAGHLTIATSSKRYEVISSQHIKAPARLGFPCLPFILSMPCP